MYIADYVISFFLLSLFYLDVMCRFCVCCLPFKPFINKACKDGKSCANWSLHSIRCYTGLLWNRNSYKIEVSWKEKSVSLLSRVSVNELVIILYVWMYNCYFGLKPVFGNAFGSSLSSCLSFKYRNSLQQQTILKVNFGHIH